MGLIKPSSYPNANAGLIWNVTADIEQQESDDESLHDLAVIHLLLALKVKKQSEKLPTVPSEGNLLSDWMEKGTRPAPRCGLEGHVRGTSYCMETMAEQQF